MKNEMTKPAKANKIGHTIPKKVDAWNYLAASPSGKQKLVAEVERKMAK